MGSDDGSREVGPREHKTPGGDYELPLVKTGQSCAGAPSGKVPRTYP